MIPGFKPPDLESAKEALRYFATAFAFLLGGLLALTLNAAPLAGGDFTAVKVVAGLHLLTLGWVSLSIMGALQVFLGVAVGLGISYRGLSPWVRRAWALGALVFPLGLLLQEPWLVAPGVLLIGGALAVFSLQVVPALVLAPKAFLTRGFFAVALLSIWAAWGLGFLAGLSRAGVSGLSLPPSYFASHVLIASFGWVGAMIHGVGAHLVPMFALSRTTTQLPTKAALPFWAAVPTAGLLAAFHPSPWNQLAWLSAFAAVALWFLQFALFIKNRVRKERDYGLLLAGASSVFGFCAWGLLMAMGSPLPFVSLVIIGWLSLFTLGIYHRVVPFLVWFVRFSRGGPRSKIIRVKDLMSERLARGSFFCATAGVVLWTLGLMLGHSVVAVAGALSLLSAGLLALAQIRVLGQKES